MRENKLSKYGHCVQLATPLSGSWWIALTCIATFSNAEPGDKKNPAFPAPDSNSGIPQMVVHVTIRLQDDVKHADTAALRGSQLMADGDFEGAVEQYRNAIDLLPVAPRTEPRRRAYVKQFSRAATTLAGNYADEGRYDSAIDLIVDTLQPSISPDHLSAHKLLERLTDAERVSPALTAQQLERIGKVKEALKVARKFLDSAEVDRAEIEYQNILKQNRLKNNEGRLNFYDSATDATRSAFLRKIAAEWELPPTPVAEETKTVDQNETE